MAHPHRTAKDDAGELKIADGVQDRLTLAREDVEHRARYAAGLCAHGGAPEAEERAIAGEE